jgi:flagellar basal-body rod protein FlgF
VNNGVYTAYSGMKAQMDALEITSNNLSNANSVGFKSDHTFYTYLDKELNSTQGKDCLENTLNRSIQAGSAMDFSNGVIESTGRDLDVAIQGDGFLTVETPRGMRYTRNGNMHLDSRSILSNSDGYPIIGTSGNPITLGPSAIINESGDVLVNGAYVDRLKVVSFEDRSKLAKEGSSLLVYRSDKEPKILEKATLRPGSLEQSNVNSVEMVVQMVNMMRQFESIQKCVNLEMNEMNGKAIEKLGR